MIVRIDKRFAKDSRKISEVKLLNQLADLIETLQHCESIKDINDIRKLTSFQDYYRIRLGSYRIGLQIKHDEIILIRILHRKDIYTYFP